jgi:predicted amidohydrolase YtcJ
LRKARRTFSDKTDFDRMIAEARKGALVRVHAIGDGTVRAILDVFEQVRKLNPESISQCQQISHNLFLRDEDIPRFRRLNVVANFSPVIFYRSPSMSALEEALGAEDCFLKESIRQF